MKLSYRSGINSRFSFFIAMSDKIFGAVTPIVMLINKHKGLKKNRANQDWFTERKDNNATRTKKVIAMASVT